MTVAEFVIIEQGPSYEELVAAHASTKPEAELCSVPFHGRHVLPGVQIPYTTIQTYVVGMRRVKKSQEVFVLEVIIADGPMSGEAINISYNVRNKGGLIQLSI